MHDHEPSHSHAHSHSHAPAVSASNRKLLWGILVLSLGYMVAEIVGGLVSGSLALLADAGHMALDAFAIALGLFAFWISRRPPTEKKTFGYYRAEIIAAFVNAATLLVAAIWIFYEAYERLKSPPAVAGGLMTMVAMGGLVVNGISIFLMARQSRDSLNMHGIWLHLLTDALGSLAALVAAFLVWKFGWTLADPIISIAIGVLILFGSWRLLLNSVNVLLVAVPDDLDAKQLQKDIEAIPQVEEVHDLHVWAMNTGLNSLTAHLKLAKGAKANEVLEATTKLLREKYHIDHATLQLEDASFSHGALHFCAPGRPFHKHAEA